MTSRWRNLAESALGQLIRLEQVVAVALLAVVLTTMAAQVIARYVLHTPLSWSEEVARLAMVWLTFIAASFILARREHIAVDLRGAASSTTIGKPKGRDGDCPDDRPLGRLGRLRHRLLAIAFDRRLTSALVLVTTLLLLFGGLPFVIRVHPVGSPGTGISKTYWYGAASVGMALMALHSAADLIGIRVDRESATESSPEDVTT